MATEGETDSAHYKKAYGQWAGFPTGNKPDLTRCCERLYSRLSPGGYQCNRPRGHGPDKAYCRTHDPAKVAERQAKSTAKYETEMDKMRYQWSGRKFYDVLEKIAAGHNDARGLAQQAIDEFKRD